VYIVKLIYFYLLYPPNTYNDLFITCIWWPLRPLGIYPFVYWSAQTQPEISCADDEDEDIQQLDKFLRIQTSDKSWSAGLEYPPKIIFNF
jgi:hypothetical protein